MCRVVRVETARPEIMEAVRIASRTRRPTIKRVHQIRSVREGLRSGEIALKRTGNLEERVM